MPYMEASLRNSIHGAVVKEENKNKAESSPDREGCAENICLKVFLLITQHSL